MKSISARTVGISLTNKTAMDFNKPPKPKLTEEERQLLAVFKSLPADKQQTMLTEGYRLAIECRQELQNKKIQKIKNALPGRNRTERSYHARRSRED